MPFEGYKRRDENSGYIQAGVVPKTTENADGTLTQHVIVQSAPTGTVILTDGSRVAHITTDGALQVQDRFLAIAKGEVSSHSLMLKFGRNPDIDQTEETIWEGGGVYPFPTGTYSLEILSSDADDTAVGTGARTVTLIGQDGSGAEQTAVVTMNGATPVAISGTWFRVYRCSVTTAGSSNVNEGTLTVRVAGGGTTLLVVGANNGQTLMAVYTIPSGKTGYMIRYYASLNTATPTTPAAMDVKLFTRPNGGIINLKHQQSCVAGVLDHTFPAPFRITERTDIYVNATTSANNSDVCAGFDIVLVSN